MKIVNKIINKGFTFIELLLAIAVIGIFATLIFFYASITFKNLQAKQLADQSIAYAKYFSDYINYNKNIIFSLIKNDDSIIVSLEGVPGAINIPLPKTFTKTNIYGQVPCLSITKNNSGKLFPMLFYVGGSSDKHVAQKAALILGAKGGYQDKNKDNSYIVRSSGGWEIDDTTPYLKNKSAEIYNKCKSNIADYSVFLNLAMFSYFNSEMAIKDTYLSREIDLENKLGSYANRNTLTSDIYLNSESSDGKSYNAIQFGSGASIKVNRDSDNEIDVQGGGFAANSLRSYSGMGIGESCLENEVGKIYKRNISDKESTYEIAYSNLVCSYTPIMCTLLNNKNESKDYCYIPTKNNTMQIPSNEIDRKSPFLCPRQIPIAIDANFSSSPVNVTYAVCSRNNDDINSAATCSNYSEIKIKLPSFAQEKFFAPNSQYKVKIGYETKIDASILCNSVCPQFNSFSSRYNSFGNSWRCFCGDSYWNATTNYYIVKGILPVNILNMTCTNRLILNKN